MKTENKNPRCEVRIQFDMNSMTKDELNALFESQKLLLKAGIYFDTGAGGGKRDWEFDWSLKGPVKVKLKNPVEKIARICHQVNKAYCESQKDDSQVDWEDAPEWQKTPVINGVKLYMDNPDLSPSASHEAWLAEKEGDGWKYGVVKNESLKTHPCCVGFEDLPVNQQAKDFIFKAIVNAIREGGE